MLRKNVLVCGIFAIGAMFSTAVNAGETQLQLCYDYVDIGGGQFEYEFQLSLTEDWVEGMGWRWFIWGDQSGAPSPLTGFVGDPDDLPVGPWTGYSSSGGGHNGPTFSPVLEYWVPESQDEVLTWSGTSTAALDEPDMLFSTLAGTLGGAVAANFTVATQGCGGNEPTCSYTIKKSKAKRGCEECPEVGDDFGSEAACESVKDCDKKIKTVIACPDGNGTCKIKAKRSGCE